VPSTSLAVDRYVLAAVVVLTCVLFTSRAADPVNVIKLTALMLAALALLASAIYRIARHRVVQLPLSGAAWAAAALLVALGVVTVTAPVTTTAVVGAYGRNSGLLAYASVLVLFAAAVRALQPPRTRVLLGAIVLAGLFTASYGLLQRVGIDAVPWDNPFNPVIAALGNPNFASGYMGIAASVAAGAALWSGWATAWRWASGATAVLCLLAAALSNSVQGPIAAAAGLVVVAAGWFLTLDLRVRRAGLGALGGSVIAGIGVLLLGALVKAGPAAAIFGDYGSRARTYYWDAALDMFTSRPVVGVGLDHYGSYWRSARSSESVAFLGGSSYSDAAHSVPLQMLAQGGLLLGLAYAAFVTAVLVALVRGLLRLTGPDRTLLAAIGGGWAAYQVQSFVSIDQVPLMVLHFTLAGAVIATAGHLRFREVRLPGALAAPVVHPNDVRTKRRLAASAPRERELAGADYVVLSVAAVLILLAAWQAFDPLRANVAIGQGDKLLARGQGNGALEAYERATDLAPGQAVYWGREGSLFEQVQQPARARAAWAEAAERDPFDVAALRATARLAEAAGDLDAARQRYTRALEVDPLNVETVLEASTFELRHSGAQAARDLLERTAPLLPQEAAVWATLGDARLVLGDVEAARAAYEQALALQPGQPTAVAGLEKLDAAA
jgi:putative inorganic carbon (HCO3(-)) transporter